MPRHSVRHISNSAAAGASALALVLTLAGLPRTAAAWPVGQDDSVTIDDFTATAKEGDVITIKHAEFQGTNLSKEEIEKLLTPDTPEADKNALMQKAKIGAMSIPTIEIAKKGGAGAIHIRDVSAADVDAGKVGKFSIASVDGGGVDAEGPISIKSGPIKVENANLGDALGSGDKAAKMSSMGHIGAVSLSTIDLVVPDKDAGPGKTMHIALGSFELRNNYDGDVLKDGSVTMKGLVFEPSKGSDFANSLTMFGYSKLDLGASISVHYDSAGKKLTIDDFSINGADAGALGLKASFENIDPSLFGADEGARMGAVAGGAITSIELKFVNAGLFEKTLAFVAQQQKVTPEALKTQWAGMAGQVLPAVLGGDPSALKVAAEAQKFIGAPSNLTVTVKPKSGSFKFSDAISAGDPMGVLSGLEIVATANK